MSALGRAISRCGSGSLGKKGIAHGVLVVAVNHLIVYQNDGHAITPELFVLSVTFT